MLEDVYDFLGTFLIFPVDHFRSVVTRNLINNSRNQALRGKFHLEIVQGKIKISDPKNTKYDLQFVFRNNSILWESEFIRLFTSLQIVFSSKEYAYFFLNARAFRKKVVLRIYKFCHRWPNTVDYSKANSGRHWLKDRGAIQWRAHK